MSYYYLNTGKEALIREIHKMASSMGKEIEIDANWSSSYEDLLDIKHEVMQDLIQTDSLMGRGIINARKIFKQD